MTRRNPIETTYHAFGRIRIRIMLFYLALGCFDAVFGTDRFLAVYLLVLVSMCSLYIDRDVGIDR